MSKAPSAVSSTLRSMTGYAQAKAEREEWVLRITLRSVNHRFLDVRVRAPEGFEIFEPQIRQLVREHLGRGHVDVALHIEALRTPAVHINRNVAAAYIRAIEELRSEFGLAPEPHLGALLRLPGVVVSAGNLSGVQFDEEELERLGFDVAACLTEALQKLDEMREEEGRSLASELRMVTSGIAERVTRLESLCEESRPAYAERLRQRVQELLGNSAVDSVRLAQEAALLAERADVAEELMRLQSHVQQFDRLVSGAGELGKKLDFLLQEMQREANTMLSKTPGLGPEGLEMTDLGLQIKAEIEKLREQVQNVE